jgi:hypothetical protein
MSWVNERGSKEIIPNINYTPWAEDENEVIRGATIYGVPIGTAVINHQLVIFTHNVSTNTQAPPIIRPDSIYVFWQDNDTLYGKVLYNGNLNFSIDSPLETSVYFEANHIQKVYWTDGRNQPRLINIAEDNDKLKSWHTDWEGTDVLPEEHWFDFVPTVELHETFNVEKASVAGGTFAPGVIQYCFTYINKYGQQTNIINVSPLFYLAHADRGGSPEDRVGAVFNINIWDPDSHFDYVRLYSIQRTSLNADPIVKLLDDIEIESYTERGSGGQAITKYKATYIDNGTTGSSMDPMELLYVGGKEITALTMADKDNTLFLGNIEQKNVSLEKVQAYFDNDNNKPDIDFYNTDSTKRLDFDRPTSVYSYTPQFNKNSYEITTFKGGETYRFGFQLQKATGEWSEPVFLNDVKNDKYPNTSMETGSYLACLPYAKVSLDISDFAGEIDNFYTIYKRIRPVVVYPNMNDKSVLCQGVLNPTVFNVEDRIEKIPYAQASWYFRPYVWSAFHDDRIASHLNFKHFDSIFAQSDLMEYPNSGDALINDYFIQSRRIEIQGSSNMYSDPYSSDICEEIDPNWDRRSGEAADHMVSVDSNTQFFIDQSIVTLNSPDIEFDTDVQLASMDDVKLRVIGMIPFTAIASSHSIYTSTALLEKGHNEDSETEKTRYQQLIGKGELPVNIDYYPNKGQHGGHLETNYSGYRLVANYLWNDVAVELATENDLDTQDGTKTFPGFFVDHLVFPWHRSGSLNNDFRGTDMSSKLDTKKESNLNYSILSAYFQPENINEVDFENASSKIYLTENAEVINISLPKQGGHTSDINYYPNIDRILTNNNGYKAEMKVIDGGNEKRPVFYGTLPWPYDDNTRNDDFWITLHTPISMKYKSTSHAIIAMNGGSGNIPILPAASYDGTSIGDYTHTSAQTFWKDTLGITQSTINVDNLWCGHYNFLWLGELYRDNVTNRFGDLKTNKWMIAGPVAEFNENSTTVNLEWLEGDTYYQRYDCLKTYAFTEQDPNQIVEILSFMCETHINLDGRYDKQRGQTRAYNMRPDFFNLLNPVYSQKDNFFLSQKIETDEQENFKYPNLITYSKTKESGADVDLWTNMTLASVLEMDGDKGSVNALERLNDQIISFQDKGVAQILYNENVQISTAAGVPIEIANSQKVQGKRYFTDKIGCSNKWSIANTPSGIYFMDSNNKGIYLFNGQVQDLSGAKGFNTWCKQNIPSYDEPWTPVNKSDLSAYNNFVSYYDALNQDVMFINKDTSLHYSDKLGAFTSFYDYGNRPYFDNFDDMGVWLTAKSVPWDAQGQTGGYAETKLLQHQAGDYMPYSMTLVANPEPLEDKLFTNLEFRATVDGEGTFNEIRPINQKFFLPFDSIEVWNEYQHGQSALSHLNGRPSMIHHENNNSALKRKFRIWQCDIPRDNYPLEEDDESRGIYRFKVSPLNRIRNPWAYIKLTKNAVDGESTMPRTEIHDMVLGYFV